MKRPSLYLFLLAAILGIASCDDAAEDIIPKQFSQIRLNRDDVYIYNSGSDMGVRLDPLLNDSIKVDVAVSYSTPKHGVVRFIENEGWFYRPQQDFTGIDSIRYTVCNGNSCETSLIRMFVEALPDWTNCVTHVQNESVETPRDTPVEIRIFMNDNICPFSGWTIRAPQSGNMFVYSYSGSAKNTVYVYTPKKGFTGTDTFRYTVNPNGGPSVEGICTITVK